MGRVRITTTHVFPPVPFRNMDWSAVTDDYEPGQAIGYGATEREAVADLVAQLEEADAIEAAGGRA